MIKWICGVSLKDRRTADELKTLVEVDPITLDIVGWDGMEMWRGKITMTEWRNVWRSELMEGCVERPVILGL